MLSNVFSAVMNAEDTGKKACTAKASNLIKSVLKVMHKHGYIGSTTYTEDGRSGIAKIKLLGRINECKSIRPRFSSGKDEFTKFEKRFLPSSDVGVLIVSTSKGVMDHRQAKKEGIGGKLLGFVY